MRGVKEGETSGSRLSSNLAGCINLGGNIN